MQEKDSVSYIVVIESLSITGKLW